MTFVLVHGLGLSSEIWSRLNPLLGDVISVDLPGHGNSSSHDFSWDGIWQAIKETVGNRDWSYICLVLHSFTACLLPEILSSRVRPARIILMEGLLHIQDVSWTNKISYLSNSDYREWLMRFRSAASIALRSQLVCRQDSGKIQNWSNAFKIVNGEALRTMAINLNSRLSSDEINCVFRLIRCPIIYLKGERTSLSFAGRELIQKNFIAIFEIPKSGHFPMLDNPDACIDIFNNY